jgi:hypothetical protein
MTDTTMSEPVDLQLPREWPKVRPGCQVCSYWARQRAAAQARGDYSEVSDCNVKIRGHHQ